MLLPFLLHHWLCSRLWLCTVSWKHVGYCRFANFISTPPVCEQSMSLFWRMDGQHLWQIKWWIIKISNCPRSCFTVGYCNFSAPRQKVHFHQCVIIGSCGVEHYWRTAALLINIRTRWKDGNFQGLWNNPAVNSCFVYSRLTFILECSDIMLLTRYLNTLNIK